jgi:alkanesulfonate monooxygenase SsuD/methylene tetrahydromethanopterin reductase-like flavin-dependent oxidoreductase (luciferase family)
MRLLMGGGMVEFHGKHIDFDRLIMAPVPKKRIPIYVGGTTPPALRRAARYGDGWVAVIHSMDEVKASVAELNRLRVEFGREQEPFDIMMHFPDAETVDDIHRLEDMGVTDLQVTPWTLPGSVQVEEGVASSMQQQPSLAVKQDAIRRYADEVIAKF